MFKLHFTHLALFFNILYEISPSTYLIVIHQVLIRPIHTYLKIESIMLERHLFYPGRAVEYFWLWPAVPPNCASQGHHSRNGLGPEWPSQDSNLGPVGLKA